MIKAPLIAALWLAAATQAGAQSLFKCTVDGKVTYQSMACAKGGETLDVPPPPTAAQVKAAQARAQEDRERMEQLAARNRAQREQRAKDEETATQTAAANKPPAKADCDKLRSQRADLYGQRNDNRRAGNLAAMGETQKSIDKLEGDYTKAACGPLD
ncbi:hypothetical protein GTP41_02275 [Pseudoduganella sp. DS3]|uniref:DUF4124 domain-containing protein n=1 Tax=Pseudoduganella guangdongensis TaxID=2692179 RepID=A0A6N9HCF1_9BURK|nr:DUF4124 domain-containing protein [Pseudoduganella guangdongensis]MYN00917.1 hypothetical protein [Pseudoduganella guangdongensis]